jgi:hypothetical protein
MHVPGAVHLPSMQDSARGQSLLSLQLFASQQPDSPQERASPQLAWEQRA